jgi:hypothetical protein
MKIKETHNILIFTMILFVLASCKNKSNDKSNSSTYESTSKSNQFEEKEEFDGYKNGDYCAEVNYYYSKTGTSSRYTLKVEIESNELVKIYWPNGGWLDHSHFNPPDISDGNARFESDKGVEYSVKIIGEDGECSYSSSAEDEEELVKKAEEETCPKCGMDKYSWKKLCNRCIDKEENTCSKCGGIEYYVNGGLCNNCKEELCKYCGEEKFSSFDEMCNSCERKSKREKEDDEE